MRLATCRRETTFFWTTLLFILSFSVGFTESTDTHAWGHRHRHKRATANPSTLSTGGLGSILAVGDQEVPNVSPPNGVPGGSQSLSMPTMPTSTPSPSVTPLTTPSVSLPTSTQTVVTPNSPSPSSSPPPPKTSATPSTSLTNSASSAPAASTSVGSPSSSSTVAPIPTGATSSSSSPVAFVPQASPSPTPTAADGSSGDSGAGSFTSVSTGPSPTSTQSSSGFFSNTGAVAGTFTAVGLLGVAGVIGVGMLIARRRRSGGYEDDMEYLDKTTNEPVEPPMRQMGAQSPPIEDDSMTDMGHYGGAPLALTSPPAAYYPDYNYSASQAQGYPASSTQGYSGMQGYAASGAQGYSTNTQGYAVSGAEAYNVPTTHGYAGGYPAEYEQEYPAHDMYSPQEYGIAYPPQAEVNSGMPNPHDFADVELDPAPVSPTQANLNSVPSALRPSVKSTPPQSPADTHYSMDSFYAGIMPDTPHSPGEAL
ncbi:hypothetical protein HYDPIDRAFT_23281 [Hydnomerulius pinastri MD-312]|nr:hypothetical protein HYDPIDRAFT_23281 [Hydnomerulius pinastri MD-312]